MVNHGTGRQANQFGRLAKVEFPKFHRDDVRGWVFICKQFFLIDNTQPKEKDVYKEAIIQRFGLVFEDLMVKLKNVKYDKSAKEHQDLFDTLLCRVDVSEDHALSLYLGGLPTELEMSVRIDSDSSNKPPLLPLPSANSISNPNPTTAVKSPVRKHLTQKECKEKRAKNLCFYCNKKFVHGHKCEGQVFALVVLRMKELEEDFKDAQEELDELENEELPQISLNAFKDVLLLPLGGCEMVLGIQWLATLGKIKCNFKELRMEFVHNNKKFIIRGPLEKMKPHEMVPKLQPEIATFDDEIVVPQQLPPLKSFDHTIPITTSIQPDSNRHLLTQKNVIQARVKELCEAGKWPHKKKRKMSRVLYGMRRCLLHTYLLVHLIHDL
ncbi:hypothetical protein Tco_0401973 [Tanacetum coccineum]